MNFFAALFYFAERVCAFRLTCSFFFFSFQFDAAPVLYKLSRGSQNVKNPNNYLLILFDGNLVQKAFFSRIPVDRRDRVGRYNRRKPQIANPAELN
jgi:hypothetical protein